MSSEDRFDLAVVGGGPAGLTAAYLAAKAGLSVIVLERGDYCGAKNVFGGVFFTNVLRQIMPDFEKDAPLERVVIRRRWSLLTPDGELAGEFRFKKFSEAPHNNSHTVLRAKFDKWFADKVEQAGAMIITGAVVDDFITEDGRIRGVKARLEGGDIYSDTIILADGVNSLLAKKLGLHPELDAEDAILAVKEVIALPEERIHDRFGVSGNEGVAYEFFGVAAQSAIGSGFIYTNKDSLSVGVGATVKSLIEHKLNPNDVLQFFKNHSVVAPLVKDGDQREYSAHLIPDGGFNKMSRLVAGNVMVVGDAAGLVNASLFHEGTNLAMESGRIAGEVAIEATHKKDFSATMFSAYPSRLSDSFVIKDLKKFKKLPKALGNNPQLFEKYPRIMEEFVRDLFTVDGEPKNKKQVRLVKALLKQESLFGFIRTALAARRAIL